MDRSSEPVEDLADRWANAAANIAACRKDLEAFFPHATPTLMAELTAAVDRHEDRVRALHKMPKRVPLDNC